MTAAPYGPASASIRRFLVQLAALGPVARGQVVQRFHDVSSSNDYHEADAVVGDVIARSARTDARDALGGPFIALMRPVVAQPRSSGESTPPGELDDLDPVAEPALGALLALLVRDLIDDKQFSALYAPFTGVIPLE